LEAFADAAYANSDDYRSQFGVCLRLGSKNGCFYSITKKQKLIALSSTESEYIALSECAREVLWVRSFLGELRFPQLSPTVVYQDNKSCIRLAENPSVADRTKHISIRHHFLKQKISNGDISLTYVPTAHMTADVLTKPLCSAQFSILKSNLLGRGLLSL